MELKDYLANLNYDTNLLRRFAYIGKREHFFRKLLYLEHMAENEPWHFHDSRVTKGDDINVLFYYIIHTFDRCFTQHKINISEDEEIAVFNTGLLTPSGEEIYCLFTKSRSFDRNKPWSNYWYLDKWVKESSREFLETSIEKPLLATYFKDYNELYFDPELPIFPNFDHIYDDNFERLPDEIQQMDKTTACTVLNGFLDNTLKRIRRNFRIPVPQFYNKEIMFLIPIKAFSDQPIVLALEKYDNGYRGNTILTLNMAYNCARLLMKPESNWLLPS